MWKIFGQGNKTPAPIKKAAVESGGQPQVIYIQRGTGHSNLPPQVVYLDDNEEAGGEGQSQATRPISFPQLIGGRVLVINHHWSWVIFKDLPFWAISVVSLFLSALAPIFSGFFEPSLTYFAPIIILSFVIWWRIRFWQRDCWEIDLGGGALRDVNIPWHQLSTKKRVAGGKSGLANWETVEPFPAWFLGRIGHIEFEAVAEKENALLGIKYPGLIDEILASWRNGQAIEDIENLYLQWQAKKTPIESLWSNVVKLTSLLASRQGRRENQEANSNARVVEADEQGRGTGIRPIAINPFPGPSRVVYWSSIESCPRPSGVIRCGLMNCSSLLDGKMSDRHFSAIEIDEPKSRNKRRLFFCRRQHLNRASRLMKRQINPGLRGIDLPAGTRFVEQSWVPLTQVPIRIR